MQHHAFNSRIEMRTKNATQHLLMVRPARFAMNAQTAVDNHYQDQQAQVLGADELAKAEFDQFVKVLRSHGVHIHIVQDSEEPHTPDSLFPNNWISMHEDGTVVLYPMKAENRRLERLTNIQELLASWGFSVSKTVDLSQEEKQGVFLEGTGALIFDHDARLVYMARSQRADETLLKNIAATLGYQPVVFSAFQATPQGRQAIYHTNVMMCVTDAYVVACLDAIDDQQERAAFVAAVKGSGKEILEISESQKHQFAGNMLLVRGSEARELLVMSTTAYRSLHAEQVAFIEAHHTIVHSHLPTIEQLGGGSARCMLAEIYLPQQS